MNIKKLFYMIWCVIDYWNHGHCFLLTLQKQTYYLSFSILKKVK